MFSFQFFAIQPLLRLRLRSPDSVSVLGLARLPPRPDEALLINPHDFEILARIPMNRIGNADEIAYGMLYLASDESAFVTGSELVIDGGVTAQ